MTVPVQIRIDPELLHVLDAAADAERLPRNELWARLLANAVGRPELAIIRRRTPGIKRRGTVAIAAE